MDFHELDLQYAAESLVAALARAERAAKAYRSVEHLHTADPQLWHRALRRTMAADAAVRARRFEWGQARLCARCDM